MNFDKLTATDFADREKTGGHPKARLGHVYPVVEKHVTRSDDDGSLLTTVLEITAKLDDSHFEVSKVVFLKTSKVVPLSFINN